MARYENEEQAAAAGYRIVHEPDAQRYALYFSEPGGDSGGADGGSGDAPGTARAQLVGEAHYSLIGDSADGVIDFDHTVVSPALRGTGLAGLLAHRTVTSDAIGERRMRASCWFIAGYLEKHPDLMRA